MNWLRNNTDLENWQESEKWSNVQQTIVKSSNKKWTKAEKHEDWMYREKLPNIPNIDKAFKDITEVDQMIEWEWIIQ